MPTTEEEPFSYSPILQQIHTLKHNSSQSVVVSISGGSSTGKSTQALSTILNTFEGESETIQIDCMMGSHQSSDTLHPVFRWDYPKLYRLDLVRQFIENLRNGRSIDLPIYDFASGKTIGQKRVDPKPIIVVEGLYSNFSELESAADLSLYIEAPAAVRLIRRSFRNMHERYRLPDPSRTIEGFVQSVIPAHRKFVVTQRPQSHHVLEFPYDFQNTLRRFDCRELRRTLATSSSLWAELTGARIELCERPEHRIQLIANDGACYIDCPISSSSFRSLQELDPLEC